MTMQPSPELEALTRRILATWSRGDTEAMANLFSSNPMLRVLGFDADEQWRGPDEFVTVYTAQRGEWPEWQMTVQHVEAFEDNDIGWALAYSTISSPEASSVIRNSAVFRLEAGAWRVIQWHNSIPVPNQQVFGVDLTMTLDGLVTSVLGDSAGLASSVGPEGTLTLVFTDIVDSTLLAGSMGDAAWADLIQKHEATIARVTNAQGGEVVKFLGDGSMLSFASARAAVRTGVDIQRACADEPFAVRIGIHTGEVIRTSDDLLGLTVNKAARVASAAVGGAIMVSSTTRELVGSMDGIRMGETKLITLKGLADAHQVTLIEWD